MFTTIKLVNKFITYVIVCVCVCVCVCSMEKEMATHSTPVFLPGASQGWRSLVGCRLWGCTESDTTEAT